MRLTLAAIFSVGIALNGGRLWAAESDDTCPKTTAQDPLFGAAIPGWYGTEGLAVQLSNPAIWPTTPPGALIGAKLFWRSSGFRAGTESNLKIEVKNKNGGPVTGHISEATNAYIPSVQPGRVLTDAEAKALANEMTMSVDGWKMLTGIDFPEPGCWEISADYLGQTLTFVVETVRPDVDTANAE